ncbi:hypothetical protein Emed_003078 [Eimeria media]
MGHSSAPWKNISQFDAHKERPRATQVRPINAEADRHHHVNRPRGTPAAATATAATAPAAEMQASVVASLAAAATATTINSAATAAPRQPRSLSCTTDGSSKTSRSSSISSSSKSSISSSNSSSISSSNSRSNSSSNSSSSRRGDCVPAAASGGRTQTPQLRLEEDRRDAPLPCKLRAPPPFLPHQPAGGRK